MENPSPPWPPPIWAPPVPPVPPVPPAKGRGVVLLVVVAVLIGAGVVLVRRAQPQGPRWAKAWDVRVEPLARFVERERGLRFAHPVTVTFVPEDEFLAELRKRRADAAGAAGTSGASTPADVPELPFERAFGLVPADFRAAQSSSDSAAGVVGAYDPWTREIRLRGVELTPSVRVTLTHELTHALQDQRFDLRKRQSEPDTNAAGLALLSVIEGDATLVERAYVKQLSAAEREQMGVADGDVVDAPELDRVPDALLTTSNMPYVLGPTFVGAVDLLGPPGARDDLFRRPPATDVSVLFPDRFLRGSAATFELDAPRLAAAEVELESGRFGDDAGAFQWLVVLASRLDVHEAVRAVEGWAGDRIVTFRGAGGVCARASIGAVDVSTAEVLTNAFDAWVAAGPPGSAESASVSRSDRIVTVTSCDKGVGDPPDDARLDDPLLLLDFRNGALTVKDPFGRSGVGLDARTCLGDAFAAGVTLAELRDLAAVSDDRFDELGASARAACGLGS